MATKPTVDMALARSRVEQWIDTNQAQGQREKADLRMFADDQWPDDVRYARMGQQAQTGMPPIPARPCLTINKLREPVRQVTNQEREADIGVEVVPADDFGELGITLDDTEIRLREGLIRRIQRESDASDARSWAFERAVIAGRGYELVCTRRVSNLSITGPATPSAFDQEVYVHRIYDQSMVGLDPAHERPDGSDAEWGFVGSFLTWEAYKAQFPAAARRPNRVSSANTGEFSRIADDYPDWFVCDGETRACLVVDYYTLLRTTRAIVLVADGRVFWRDEAPDDAEIVDEYDVEHRQVYWAKIDGANDEPLEVTEWPGRYIPIVQFLGEEVQPYDDERRAQGMVRPGRDAQQGFNAMASKGVETVGYAPIPPWLVAEGQVAGYEAAWEVSNTRAVPYLTYKTKDLQQNVVGPPVRTPQSVDLTGIFTCLQMFDEAVKSTTGVPSVALGQQTDADLKSGKAIKALQQQAAAGTSNYMDNYRRSVRHEGKVVNDLLYPIYGRRPGRLARIVNGENEAETVTLGAPKDGKTHTLTPGASNANVVIKVTRNFDTRRDEIQTQIGELISAAPLLMTWFGDLWFKNQDGPGHEQMAERAKAMLDPKIQALLAQQAQASPLPPEVQQQIAQLQGQLQQLQQQLQQAGQVIQTKQVEAQAEVQAAQVKQQAEDARARIDADVQLRIAEMDNATKLQLAEYAWRGQQMQAEIDARERQLGAQQQAASDHAARRHEVGMAAAGEARAQSASETERAAAAEQAEAGRTHEQQMAAEAAERRPDDES